MTWAETILAVCVAVLTCYSAFLTWMLYNVARNVTTLFRACSMGLIEIAAYLNLRAAQSDRVTRALAEMKSEDMPSA